MKRAFIISFIVIVTAFSMFSATTADEKVSLKGTVSIANKIHAEFKSGGVDYVLLIPRFILGTDIKDGEQAEIEGFKISKELIQSMGMYGRQLDTTKDTNYIVVTKITYNGKTIDVTKERNELRNKMMGDREPCPGMNQKMRRFDRGNKGYGPQQKR